MEVREEREGGREEREGGREGGVVDARMSVFTHRPGLQPQAARKGVSCVYARLY